MYFSINENIITNLFRNATLPSEKAHKPFYPPYRNEQLNIYPNSQYDASVGIILYIEENHIYTIFIRKTPDNSPHSHQIAFPGGTKEPQENLLDTVYRELKEEIGIDKKALNLIRPLSSLYIPVSQYMVYPFVFFTNEKPNLVANPNEVEEILFLKVSDFYKKENIGLASISINNKIYQVPAFFINNNVIWGATSMIWNECLCILKPLFT